MNDLLPISLDAAIPVWIIRVQQAGPTAWQERLAAKSGEWSQTIAERADNLLYRGKRKGEAAELFNMLAEALAHMAFLPGGVKAFGRHWEARFDG